MKSIQEIALKVATDYLKFKLGDRKGFNVYDIDASDADELIAEIEKECVVSFMYFLARVDAERGKDAAAYAVRNDFEGSFLSTSLCGLKPVTNTSTPITGWHIDNLAAAIDAEREILK